MSNFTVFLLPFAGGNSYSYNIFRELTPKRVSFIPVELPGRGTRMREPLMSDLDMLSADVFKSIKNKITAPYAIYGHSMGTLLGYRLAHLIIENGLPLPQHLFFTGRGGPSFPDNDVPRYLMNRDEFIAELRRLGGVPEEVLAMQSLMDFFEPILRSDFKAVETYRYDQLPKLDIPITVGYGMEEDLKEEEINAWQLECSRPVEFIRFPGGHFFIFDRADEVISMIVDRIDMYTLRPRT
jgi:surfactin synthase thioesterase subunit